jgi:hypothetical protein
VHLPTAKRIAVWSLWMLFVVTLTSVIASDIAAGGITCPRPVWLRVLVWGASIAAVLGDFMAETEREQPEEAERQ